MLHTISWNIFAPVRNELAIGATAILHTDLPATAFVCAPQGADIKSAAPLMLHADASELASKLHARRSQFTLLGVPLVACVYENGGHLLFRLTDAFYTALLREVLMVYPPAPPLSAGEELPPEARHIHYAQRRMWMLARYAEGEVCCPTVPAIQRALFLSAGVGERLDHPRALQLRLEEASTALTTMFHTVLPHERSALMRESAFVGEAAARILFACLYPETLA